MRVRMRKTYEAAFREQAVALMERTDRRLTEVASSLGVPAGTLNDWYNREMARRRGKPKGGPGAAAMLLPPTAETAQQKLVRLERENAALRKENDDLKLDREILKKAAAFFAKESK
jgi:transposase